MPKKYYLNICLIITTTLLVATESVLAAEQKSIDVDLSGEVEPLTDGLMIIRHQFGFESEALVSGALGDDSYRTDPDKVSRYIDTLSNELDLDGDGQRKPLTDGLLVIRALFGFSGQALANGAIGTEASIDDPQLLYERFKNIGYGSTNPRDLIGHYYSSSRSGIFGEESAQITIELNEDQIAIEADRFFSSDYRFVGTIDDDSTPITIAGTYQTSDFKNGNWTVNHVLKLTRDALYLDLNDGLRDLRMLGFIQEYDIEEGEYSEAKTYIPSKSNELQETHGSYIGKMKTYDQCSNRVFEVSNTDLTLEFDGGAVTITQDSFFEGICILNGTINSGVSEYANIAGSFLCSDFKQGTWSTNNLTYFDQNLLFTKVVFKLEDSDCEYEVAYLVQK